MEFNGGCFFKSKDKFILWRILLIPSHISKLCFFRNVYHIEECGCTCTNSVYFINVSHTEECGCKHTVYFINVCHIEECGCTCTVTNTLHSTNLCNVLISMTVLYKYVSSIHLCRSVRTSTESIYSKSLRRCVGRVVTQ